MSDDMDIAVFGSGYVGAVSAAGLAKAEHAVVGVDSKAGKADLIDAGGTGRAGLPGDGRDDGLARSQLRNPV